jgi:uncharacterized protein YbbC (DUF1343 family)
MKTKVKTGIEILLDSPKSFPLGDSPAILCNEASVCSNLTNAIDALIGSGVRLKAIFGPQHGFYCTDQANMIEWESEIDPRTKLPFISLYGAHRKPTPDMLAGISSMIIDLQDVGARFYTYLWSALLTLRACADMGIPVILCDRPNPIGGEIIEGPGIEVGFESFVGLADLPVRHGLTIGEALYMLALREGVASKLHVAKMSGWHRWMSWPDTGLEWVNPSPNMPGYRTALVYPGGCLLEATNISEGRGTTRPFELVGAPWIDMWDFSVALDAERLPGAIFRPTEFKPVFDKFSDQICRGIQVHAIDEAAFRPVLTYYAIIKCARTLYPGEFRWADPPYEYEFEKLPIDILAGSETFRKAVEACLPTSEVAEIWRVGELSFENERREHLVY